jgi:hypothetical protein
MFVRCNCLLHLADRHIFATSPNEVFSASIKPLAWLYGRRLFFRRKIPTSNFIVSFDVLKLQLPTQPIFQRVHFSLWVKPSVEIAPVSLPKNRFRLAFTFCKALCQQLPSRSDSRIYLRFYVFNIYRHQMLLPFHCLVFAHRPTNTSKNFFFIFLSVNLYCSSRMNRIW